MNLNVDFAPLTLISNATGLKVPDIREVMTRLGIKPFHKGGMDGVKGRAPIRQLLTALNEAKAARASSNAPPRIAKGNPARRSMSK